jgi:hypothetical protein
LGEKMGKLYRRRGKISQKGKKVEDKINMTSTKVKLEQM